MLAGLSPTEKSISYIGHKAQIFKVCHRLADHLLSTLRGNRTHLGNHMKDQLKKLLGHNYDRPRISKPTSERQQKEEVYLLVAVSLLIYQTLEGVKISRGLP